ncbi:MAG: lysine--tRNA ligase [Candidatus Diapherotrites archaeon]|nr:lysine--tRNA ligase [Candidatus Diapherotrites archaeon]
MHWSDSYAKQIVARKPDKEEYVVESGITPSGIVHAGNFREVLTQDFVYRALLKLGVKARYQYVWDDYDRFRKVPAGVPESWKKEAEDYIGIPVSETPDPWGCHKSYSEHFASELIEENKACDVEADYIWMSKEYKKCTFAENMKIALENKDSIREILNDYRKEPLSERWMPVRVYCEKCGKDTTSVEYLGGYRLRYKCECGHSGEFDFRKKGNAKMVWRVCWPQRWAHYDVDFESSGKDHHASGGSWDTGVRISKNVFKHEPPIGPMYEFVYAKGQKEKMSSSKGNVFTVSELLEVYEPEIVRFIYTPKINRAIEVPFDEGVFNYYEAYDLAERVFFGKETPTNDREKENLVAAYELSQIRPRSKWQLPVQPPFTFLVDLVQVASDTETAIGILQRTGHVPKKLSQRDIEKVKLRLKLAKNWAEKYAPEKRRVKILEEVPDSVMKGLSERQREALSKLPDAVKQAKSPAELGEQLKRIVGDSGLKPREFFEAAYLVLLGKKQGPRLATFLLSLDEEVIERCNQISR